MNRLQTDNKAGTETKETQRQLQQDNHFATFFISLLSHPRPFFTIPSEWSDTPADDLLPSDAASGRVLRTLCVICPEEQRLTAWRHRAARPQGYRASGLSGHNLWGVGPFGLWMRAVATTLSADDMSRACRGTHAGLPLGLPGRVNSGSWSERKHETIRMWRLSSLRDCFLPGQKP